MLEDIVFSDVLNFLYFVVKILGIVSLWDFFLESFFSELGRVLYLCFWVNWDFWVIVFRYVCSCVSSCLVFGFESVRFKFWIDFLEFFVFIDDSLFELVLLDKFKEFVDKKIEN